MTSKIKQELCQNNLKILNISNTNSPMTQARQYYDDSYIEGTTPQKRYEDRFESVVPDFENLTQAELKLLKNAYIAMRSIDEALEPLTSIGYHCSIGLAGGAIRDWTQRNTELVKDFDIYINISRPTTTHNYGEKTLPILTKEELSDILPIDKLNLVSQLFDKIDLKDSSNRANNGYEILDVVLEDLLAKTFTIDKHYASQNIEAQYLQNDIASNFKLTLPSLDTKIDLIVSEYPMEIFMATFDFEICKCGISYESSSYPVRNSKPSKSLKGLNINDDEAVAKSMYSNLIYNHSCLKDFADKTLSLQSEHFTMEHIQYFMNKHYVKLKQKFQNHDLIVRHANNTVGLEIAEYCESMDEKISLNQHLPLKTANAGILKI